MSDLSGPANPGRPAILCFEVIGPERAEVRLAVEHRDGPGCPWSCAGSLTALAPATVHLAVPALKDEPRFRFDVVGSPDGEPIDVRVLPPRWLPG